MSTEEDRMWEAERDYLRDGSGAWNVGQIMPAWKGKGVLRIMMHKDVKLPGPDTNIGAREIFQWVVLSVAKSLHHGATWRAGAGQYGGKVADKRKHEKHN